MPTDPYNPTSLPMNGDKLETTDQVTALTNLIIIKSNELVKLRALLLKVENKPYQANDQLVVGISRPDGIRENVLFTFSIDNPRAWIIKHQFTEIIKESIRAKEKEVRDLTEQLKRLPL